MKIRERALCALGKQAEQAFRQILPGESFMNPLSFTFLYLGLPSGSDGKESACRVGDVHSIPGSGTFPGEGNGYPLQNSCMENSMD